MTPARVTASAVDWPKLRAALAARAYHAAYEATGLMSKMPTEEQRAAWAEIEAAKAAEVAALREAWKARKGL